MTASAYPGAELGLPERGPGSLAPFSRRLIAVFIDWMACTFIALAILDVPWGGLAGTASLLPLGVFALENLLLVSTAGMTLGHGLLGMRVHRVDALRQGRAGMPGLRSGLIRAALLCLLIPALITDRNGRGLHDRAAGTLLLRSR
ncbi:RDD family protein [Ornithinimicrobium murale]|uniref:RDD family protein n=1 Tax=Ornithinimicrobium murale TaxID=1050153 RepID=UPI000E0D95C0|nr:RDD family protein [Ornithinimicrobium murale]